MSLCPLFTIVLPMCCPLSKYWDTHDLTHSDLGHFGKQVGGPWMGCLTVFHLNKTANSFKRQMHLKCLLHADFGMTIVCFVYNWNFCNPKSEYIFLWFMGRRTDFSRCKEGHFIANGRPIQTHRHQLAHLISCTEDCPIV
jgi:hypothetical protein